MCRHLLLEMCVFESVCAGGGSSRTCGGSEAADLSLTPCVVFVLDRWRAASRYWKSSRPTVWRDFWTHWGVYKRVCVFQIYRDMTHKDFNIFLCRLLLLLLQVYDTASKWWQHLQTNQGPPAMRKRRAAERGREDGVHLKEEKKEDEEETNASGW